MHIFGFFEKKNLTNLKFTSRTRGVATGLTAALSYVLSFISTKIYYNLETAFSLPGVALFNCIIIAFGLVLMYKILPETENRTLEDIETHFADKTKKLTDRKILKKSKRNAGKMSVSSDISTKPVSAISIDDMNKNHFENGFANPEFINDREHTKF